MPDFVSKYQSYTYPSKQQALSNVGQVTGISTFIKVTSTPSVANSGATFSVTGSFSVGTGGTIPSSENLILQKLNGTSWTNVTTLPLLAIWTVTTSITTGTTFRIYYAGNSTLQSGYSNSFTVKCWGKVTQTPLVFSNTGEGLYLGCLNSTSPNSTNGYYGGTFYQSFDTTPAYLAEGVTSVNGKQGSAIAFNLSGITTSMYITKVELYLNATDWAGTGGTAYAYFNFYDGKILTVPKTSGDYLEAWGNGVSGTWTSTGAKWIDISSLTWPGAGFVNPSSAGTNLSIWTGFASGITLFINNSSSTYAGKFSTNVQLRISYYKYGYV